MAQIDPSIIQMLTPGAIGSAVALMVWAAASNWIINHLKGGVAQIQTSINKSDFPGVVKVDGLAIQGGETVNAISRMAYEAIYPDDKQTAGQVETRRPLP